MFSPVLSTWCDAINAGHLATWPALTSAQVRRHFPGSIPMHLGHMDQMRTNIQSTKPTCVPPMHDKADTERTNAVFVDLHSATGKVFSDQTGRFTTTSTSGNAYLMIIYDFDYNFIHAEPLQSRSGLCILAAYQKVHTFLTSRGLQPRLQRLDNKASHAILQFMESHNIDIQLFPPYVHRRSAAEWAIRTYKNHFIPDCVLLILSFQ
jgi:hypothetical protein